MMNNIPDNNFFKSVSKDLEKQAMVGDLADIEVLDLKFLYLAQISTRTTKIDKQQFKFDSATCKQVNIISQKYKISPYLFGQMVFAYLLYRHTSQQSFAINCPDFSDKSVSVNQCVNIVAYNFATATYFEDIIWQQFGGDSNSSQSSAGLNSFNLNELKKVAFAEAKSGDKVCADDVDYKLCFEHKVTRSGIIINVYYDSADIDKALLTNFINCYQRLYREILTDLLNENTERSLNDYSLLDAAEYNKIVYEWNKTDKPFPHDKTIHKLFEEQVEKTPDNIAVVFEGIKLTYTQLNNKANQLAHYLQDSYSIIPDDLIALCLQRSEQIIIAILAVLKAGAAYVPIDPDFPDDRIGYILKDTSAKVVIANDYNFARISDCCKHILHHCEGNEVVSNNSSIFPDTIAIDNPEFIQKLKKQPILNPASKVSSNNLVYVIYTSGTTGKPKGVMIEHKGVVIRVSYMIERSGLVPNSKYLFKTNYMFDVSFSDIFTILSLGATLYIAKHHFDLDEFIYLIKKYNINSTHFVPSQIEAVLEIFLKRKILNQLNIINVSGEAFNKGLLNKIRKAKFINYYGPTETGEITSEIYQFKNKLAILDKVTIGKPINNTKLHIFDANLNHLPVGAIGELYISGDSLARGYLNLPELTNKFFIPNLYQTKQERLAGKNAILYKTGDLVRYLPDGNIEYIGRSDSQVKINGHRIELLEIENKLLSYPGIKQASVLVNENTLGTKYLIAYYVSKTNFEERSILDFLSRYLPVYMIPYVMVHLKKLPLTKNGKLDKKLLLDARLKINNYYVPPRNKLENNLCNIYAELLGQSNIRIGIEDDFFMLGGTSILAVKLAVELRNKLNIDIDANVILKYRTISQLAKHIGINQPGLEKVVTKYTKDKNYQLSFAQERIWFIAKDIAGSKAYNVPLLYKLNNNCDLTILQKSTHALIQRHEILCTKIKEDQYGNAKPYIKRSNISINIKKVSSQKELTDLFNHDVDYQFNFNQEFPIRIKLYEYKSWYYLSIVIHHIAFDGWSQDILLHDLIKYYEYYSNKSDPGNSLELPIIEIQYKDFAMWQREYVKSNEVQLQLQYWKNKLANYENLNLPIDKIRPSMFDYAGMVVDFELPVNLSMQIRQCAKDLNVSLYSLLLSAYYLLLAVYSNQNDIVVGTVAANRHYKNIDNLIGFFVNTLVLRQQINYEMKLFDFIKSVFDEVVEAQLNQDIPFEQLIDELGIERDQSRHPVFQCLFVMQHFGTIKQDLLTEYKLLDIYRTSKFDLSFIFDDSNEQLTCRVEYAVSLFEIDTIKNYFKTCQIILEQLAQVNQIKSQEQQLKNLYYVDKPTYKKLVVDYNKTYLAYPQDKTIHQLFEEQVERTPDNIALVYENVRLSYRELNNRSNQLAHYIKNKYSIQPDDLIALLLNRSEYMLIAILAVLKSGGAYVPIDPKYPNNRIEYILDDTQAKLVLTNYKHCNDNIGDTHRLQHPITFLAIDDDELQANLADVQKTNLKQNSKASNLAYVIYTSGTTGTPKGVLQQHNNLVRLFNATNCLYQFNNDDIWVLVHSYVFDFSIWEIFGALIYGGKLIMPNYYQIQDLYLFYKLCLNEEITVLNQTPSEFYVFSRILLDNKINKRLIKLRYVIFGGEALDFFQLESWFNVYGDTYPQLINMYGTTETTVHTSYKVIKSNAIHNKSVIGRLLSDQCAYILGRYLNVLPIGAIGEIYIGGDGLARGYLNKLELTHDRFIINHLRNCKEKKLNLNNRLYKTGDLVRLLPDGGMQYIGRNDNQVKIRGYRVELEEIKNILNNFTDIEQSIVISKKGQNLNHKYLIAYYLKKQNVNGSDSSKIVNDWNKIYDITYSKLEISNYKQNFIGWNSSYTGLCIPQKQMLEWLNNTLERIMRLFPKRILEIGSGSGLLLFNLIENCEHYYATDFSEYAISYNQKIINSLGYVDKFNGYVSPANEIPFKELNKQYDTVILNSVIQYFPSLEYLENILINAINNINSIGQIFIGDVRNFQLLECFAYSVLKFKEKKVSIADIEYFKIKEKELLVAPEYFIYLKNKNNNIAYIEILPKLGSAINEMNCYRYDVIIHINKHTKPLLKKVDQAQFAKVPNIIKFIKSTNQETLYLKYPDAKIAKEYIETTNIFNQKCELNQNGIDSLLSIKQLNNLLKKHGYHIRIYLDALNPLYLNIIAGKNIKNVPIDIIYPQPMQDIQYFINNPLINAKLLDTQFSQKLRKYLEDNLPGYMVPQYLIAIDKIPLTPNGKIDCKALPNPEHNIINSYEPPSTQPEEQLCKIFAYVLDLPENAIGTKNNFFHIGGNSILALKLIPEINRQFNCEIKVADIFTKNTVYQLAHYISDAI